MFRDSEIYALLRERQLKRENEDVDSNDSVGSVEDSESSHIFTSRVAGSAQSEAREYSMDLSSLSDNRERKLSGFSNSTKRKRNFEYAEDGKNQEPTPRRLARELDDAVADSGDLDYGDDVIDRPKDEPSGHHAFQRKMVSYEDDEATTSTSATKLDVPETGRKIWWPTIG